ncbi:MAG: DNA topoisomerase IB [Gemmatimonadota bacterium]
MPKDNQEHVDSAEAAGLHYVSDTMPGIRRKRTGKSFTYLDSDGTPIRDKAELARIKALVIPPAWTDVWICPSSHGHIQVTARDARGRKQYRYHPKYREVRDATKFDRMLEFSHMLPDLRNQVEKDLQREGLSRDKVLASVVRLLEKTLIRVGNDEYARDNKSYGLTTMRRRHVEVTGHTLRFDFRGKSGMMHSVAVTDRRVARIVQHCQELPGQELFQYLDDDGKRQTIDAGDINDYLRRATHGRETTAKDFRTWSGTMLAAFELRSLGPATGEKEAKANIVKAIDRVAKRLGNTRAVCRKYYIHPVVLESYLAGSVLPTPPQSSDQKRERPSGALRRDELAVLEYIQGQLEVTSDK